MVGLLQRRRAGQDDVGMPRRLVEPQVDRDHRVQPGKCLVEFVSGGRGQHGVARYRDQRRDLTVAGGGDLLGQAGHRNLAQHLLRSAHPGVEPPEIGCAVLQSGDRLDCHRPRCRGREHGAAGDVEVPGQDVDDVDEPAGEAAELLVTRSDAPVDDRAGRTGELARQLTNPVGGDARDGGGP